ncbi:hypothetical protein AB0J43_41080, partial [Nonomuraea fuscirosea]
MSFSDVIRNIAKTVTNKDELKEKAKDLPLLVVQTTLSAAGQALLLVDRMKNSIKGIGAKEEREEEQDSRPSAAQQVAPAPAEAEEGKAERKEPVIFAPRPAAEPNGVAKTKPDPVIFSPAAKTEAAPAAEPEAVSEPETAAQPESVSKPEATSKPEAVAKPATADPEPETAAKESGTKTDVAPEPVQE